AANLKTPVLVSVGERDYRVPMNNALEFWTTLQRQRVPSKLIVWPTENHWILNGENSRFFYRQVQEWFARWLNTPAGSSASSGQKPAPKSHAGGAVMQTRKVPTA